MNISKIKTTHRNFPYVEFEDRYGKLCSIQKSSLATEDAIWFGIDDPDPKIMASRASRHGIKTDITTGWIPFELHEDVSIDTRMHLNTEQIKELIPTLQKFADTGEISG